MSAFEKLCAATASRKSLISIGLEPSPRSLPEGFSPTGEGYERFLMGIVEATRGIACAYKLNLAFFEALGTEGWSLMERLRRSLPSDVLLIADGKFSDIGSTAERYAAAMYDWLDVDAATVNPLMGRDSVEPWLAFRDRLTFFLVLTSNPGASDFLLADAMYRRVARRLVDWADSSDASRSIGFVVGATRGDRIAEIRHIGHEIPFLVPGVGAQGGSISGTIRAGRARGATPGLLFHVTRGILPGPEDEGEVFEIVERKARRWRDAVNEALRESVHDG